MKPMQVQGPAVMPLAHIVGFLNAGSRLRMGLERLLPQMPGLPRKLARLRVATTCTPTAEI